MKFDEEQEKARDKLVITLHVVLCALHRRIYNNECVLGGY